MRLARGRYTTFSDGSQALSPCIEKCDALQQTSLSHRLRRVRDSSVILIDGMPPRRYMSRMLSKLLRQVTAMMSWRKGDKLAASEEQRQLHSSSWRVGWCARHGPRCNLTRQTSQQPSAISSLRCNEAFATECRQSNAAIRALLLLLLPTVPPDHRCAWVQRCRP